MQTLSRQTFNGVDFLPRNCDSADNSARQFTVLYYWFKFEVIVQNRKIKYQNLKFSVWNSNDALVFFDTSSWPFWNSTTSYHEYGKLGLRELRLSLVERSLLLNERLVPTGYTAQYEAWYSLMKLGVVDIGEFHNCGSMLSVEFRFTASEEGWSLLTWLKIVSLCSKEHIYRCVAWTQEESYLRPRLLVEIVLKLMDRVLLIEP